MDKINTTFTRLCEAFKTIANPENVLDINKTFSSDNIDIAPIIRQILNIDLEFPNNILSSKEGHKYNELEFFQCNQDSSNTSNTSNTGFVDITKGLNTKIQGSKALFEKFNRTHTKLGKTLLQSIILEPSLKKINIELLRHRQIFILSFAKHKQLEEIREELKTCSNLENDILAMQMLDSPEMEEVYKVIFFQFLPLKNLNYNEVFLKLFYYFIIIFNPLYGAIAPFVFMFAPYVFMRYILKIPISFDTFWSITKNMIIGGTGFFTNLNKIINSGFGKAAEAMVNGDGVGCDGGGCGNTPTKKDFNIKNIVISIVKWVVAFMNSQSGTYIYLGFICFTYFYGIYNSTQVSITYNKIINMFHSRLNIISKWLKTALQFYNMKLGFEYPELTPIITKMKNLLTNPTIINLLNHNTFTSEPNLLSNKGIIIKTFKEFLDMKTMMDPFYKYIAYIDVWSSIGKWLQEDNNNNSPHKTVSRSICTYIQDSKTPIVNGTDLWNICCELPVYNDVFLGIDTTDTTTSVSKSTSYNNLLITGPNGAGKSTYIKSVIECILLGQTIGVVPAREFAFTPFTNISTYLNIPDCQGKESLFQAEMSRCYQQLQMLNSAETQGDFSFNIMDEIFVSTNYQEGMSGAYAIIKNFCKLKKCLNVITTHFDVLASMDEVCVSKKYFDIEIDEFDNIKGDYKIREGVSKKHMALKLLKKRGFDSSIIKDAEYLYNFLDKTRIEASLETEKHSLETETEKHSLETEKHSLDTEKHSLETEKHSLETETETETLL